MELSTQLQIKSIEDWNRVSLSQIRHFGSINPVKTNGGVKELLRRVFPQKDLTTTTN